MYGIECQIEVLLSFPDDNFYHPRIKVNISVFFTEIQPITTADTHKHTHHIIAE